VNRTELLEVYEPRRVGEPLTLACKT
jgi:hypothetical protein